jgi:lipopolysaccharide/colanic/teichoic acid biosynthesis glycosyltransferase
LLEARLPDLSLGPSAPSRLQRGGLPLTIKRGLDVLLGVTIGVLAVPLMLAIAAAIYVDSPGPVLFRATRVGRHGRPFSMYKFRTMVKDAEERLEELAHLNLAQGMIKIPDDPRVTRVGKWLRRFSLDELPQIANIVVGHMSLVGPRPHDKHELPTHGLEQDPRLSVRPGLTGLWQVTARSKPDIASRVHYDLHYVNRWSLLLDAKILAKTVPAVLRGNGGQVQGSFAAVSNGGQSRGLAIVGPNDLRIDGTLEFEIVSSGALRNSPHDSAVLHTISSSADSPLRVIPEEGC